MKYILGIDDGGSVTKAALFAMDGSLVAMAGGPAVAMSSPGPGQTERNMQDLWKANVAAIRAVIAKAGASPDDIAVVSATGHGNGLYLVDADGRPTFGAVISTDERAEGRVAKWNEDPAFDASVRAKTAQSLWPGQPPAILDWIKRNRPEVLERTRWALLASGFVRMRLTGEATANLSDASGTSIFNVPERRYDRGLLELFGLGDCERLLPPVVGACDLAGRVTREAAEQTGLKEGTPVAGGVFDIAASALASGLVDKNRLAVVTGTWAINEFVADAPVVDPDLFMSSIYPTDHAWLVTEGSPTSAGAFEWFINSVLSPAAALGGGDVSDRARLYDAVDDLVFAKDAESSAVPAFLPFVFGTSRHPMTRGAFTGLDSSAGLGQIIRSIYEGVVFSHLDHIEQLEKYQDLPGEAIFTGGIANSPRWTQLFADASQRELHVVQVKEAGALGTAMAGAVLAGEYGRIEDAALAMNPGFRVVEPDSSEAQKYADRFGAWKQTLTRMEGANAIAD